MLYGEQTVRDKCFEKCITKPGNSLSSSEQQCLARCCDRYTDVRFDTMPTPPLTSHQLLLLPSLL